MLKILTIFLLLLFSASVADAYLLNFNRLVTIPTAVDEIPTTHDNPLGIAFGGPGGDLYLVDDSGPNEMIHRITTAGVFVSSLTIPEPSGDRDIAGMTFLPNGNLLLADKDPSRSRIIEVNPADLSPISSGIDFNPNSFTLSVRDYDAEGVAFHAGRNSIFMTSNREQEIIEFSLDGSQVLSSFVTTGLNAGFTSPGGITVDPATGHLFIADADFRAIYETTPDGILIGTTATETPTGRLFPSGLSLDAPTNTLYVSFADSIGSNNIAVFDLTTPIPEPSIPLLALVSGFPLLRRRIRGGN